MIKDGVLQIEEGTYLSRRRKWISAKVNKIQFSDLSERQRGRWNFFEQAIKRRGVGSIVPQKNLILILKRKSILIILRLIKRRLRNERKQENLRKRRHIKTCKVEEKIFGFFII